MNIRTAISFQEAYIIVLKMIIIHDSIQIRCPDIHPFTKYTEGIIQFNPIPPVLWLYSNRNKYLIADSMC